MSWVDLQATRGAALIEQECTVITMIISYEMVNRSSPVSPAIARCAGDCHDQEWLISRSLDIPFGADDHD